MIRKGTNDLIKLGQRIKDARNGRGLTLDEVSHRTQLSKGLLSKIENFRAIPSLPVLLSIAKALGKDVGELVGGIGMDENEKTYVFTKVEERQAVERDDAIAFFYESLGSRRTGGEIIDAFVLTISPESRRKPVTTDGEQFIFILTGEIIFEYGREKIVMSAGDALFFDGTIPHVPKCKKGEEAKLLAIYILNNERKEQ